MKSFSSAFTREPSMEEILGGVWRYRQIAEEISLGGEEEDEQTDYTDESALSTPLPSAELAFFDPLRQEGGEQKADGEEGGGEEAGLWVLSSGKEMDDTDNHGNDIPAAAVEDEAEELRKLEEEFASCGEIPSTNPALSTGADSMDGSTGDSQLLGTDKQDGGEDTGRRHSSTGISVTNSSRSGSPFPGHSDSPYPSSTSSGSIPFRAPKSGSVIEQGKGDLVASPIYPQSLSSQQSHPSFGSSPEEHTPDVSPHRSPRKLLNIDIKEKGDYIFLAANQISLAQQCEVNTSFNLAFNYYKSAVGILLTGVQSE